MPDDFEKLIPVRLRDLGKDERWLQEVIAENPQILGLDEEVSVRDKEIRQTAGGILDLLLENSDKNRRWEVEIQLGATDASHIVRTIEYWDIERSRFPQYEHCAVIVAEEVTRRFFNVIRLFNGHIPIMAIKLTAVKQSDGKVGMLFTKILDAQTRGEESNDQRSISNGRAYWIDRESEEWVTRVEKIFDRLNSGNCGSCQLRYPSTHISLKQQGIRRNLIEFYPPGDQDWGMSIYTNRQDDSINRRLADLNWKFEWDDGYGGRYLLDFPSRDLTEEEFALLRDMFRVAIGEEIESESASPAEAENSNA